MQYFCEWIIKTLSTKPGLSLIETISTQLEMAFVRGENNDGNPCFSTRSSSLSFRSGDEKSISAGVGALWHFATEHIRSASS